MKKLKIYEEKEFIEEVASLLKEKYKKKVNSIKINLHIPQSLVKLKFKVGGIPGDDDGDMEETYIENIEVEFEV